MTQKSISLSEQAQTIKTGTYQHFKGDQMLVIAIALHSETQEELVVYRHITGERAGEPYLWVRPVSMFLETVERDGRVGPRFKFIGEKV